MTIRATELLALAMPLVIGITVGVAYVQALWRAVRRITARHVGRSYLTGLLVRASLSAVALVAVAVEHPERAAMAAFGFVLTRPIAVRVLAGKHRSGGTRA